MPFNPKLKPKDYFPKVREAREALLAQALELIELKMKIAKEALGAGDYDVADKAVNWLLEHMPSHEGQTVLVPSIDKGKVSDEPKGPTINIGFAIGGMTKEAPALPAAAEVVEVIEVKDE